MLFDLFRRAQNNMAAVSADGSTGLADSVDLAADYVFVDSWFESGDAVDAALVGNRRAPHKRAAIVMEKVLEPRREWWTQAAAWGGLHFVALEMTNDGRSSMRWRRQWPKAARLRKFR
jgi:hypothetical protein